MPFLCKACPLGLTHTLSVITCQKHILTSVLREAQASVNRWPRAAASVAPPRWTDHGFLASLPPKCLWVYPQQPHMRIGSSPSCNTCNIKMHIHLAGQRQMACKRRKNWARAAPCTCHPNQAGGVAVQPSGARTSPPRARGDWRPLFTRGPDSQPLA